MKLEIANTSGVVLAQHHNPTILHPSFLRAQGIVPEDWELAGDPICMPPLATASYANGIGFTVEPDKLQIVDNQPAQEVAGSPVPALLTAYVRALPHVRYSAVGINLTGFVACPDPEAFLAERFLIAGPWNGPDLPLQALGLRFVYPAPPGTLNLSCDVGGVRRNQESDEMMAVIVRANYHTPLSTDNRLDEAIAAIELFGQRAAHFRHVAAIVLGLEE
jgi:hypothetical protein